MWRPRAAVLTLMLMLVGLTGCAPYALRGAVVSGHAPSVQWVQANDPRLAEPGLASARVSVWLDPDRLTPEKLGEVTTGGDGTFSMPIHTAGAGVLIMDIKVRGQRPPDHGSATQNLNLPHRGKHLLITLAPGPDTDPRPEGNLLERTLRDAQPFLRD